MKVFISHSWNDKSLATEINEILQKDAHEVWYDVHQLIPGDNIQTIIDAYIKRCDVVVLVWSIHAFASDGVEAEIKTAKRMEKRIIPLQTDNTPLQHQDDLKGVLGIPFDDKATGMLLLQRALLMLMASESDKQADWFKEIFGNVVDLGGYLNYVNTYRLQQNKNEDGAKEQWVTRLEGLKTKNEYLQKNVMPKAKDTMQELQSIMAKLEKGNASIAELNQWKQWALHNESFHPELMGKLKMFIENDINRLNSGGTQVSTINITAAEEMVQQLSAAIEQKKESAYQDLTQKIKKYAGFLLGEKVIQSIVGGYLNYVTTSPTILNELIQEARSTESIAVTEATVKLVTYLEGQDHEAESQKNNLEGYFDDAYLIINTTKLLIEAKLIAKEKFSLDFVSVNVVDKYVSFILDAQTKSKLDSVLQDIRNLIGLKKNEINWGRVAAVVLGAVVVGELLSDSSGGLAGSSTSGGSGPMFEDRIADFNARFGGGLDTSSPIQY